MGVNAISYPFRVMIFYSFLFMKRCWDRRCTLDKKISKCKSQKDYENMYTCVDFSLEWRYAQVNILK